GSIGPFSNCVGEHPWEIYVEEDAASGWEIYVEQDTASGWEIYVEQDTTSGWEIYEEDETESVLIGGQLNNSARVEHQGEFSSV
ncbi:unnamed protein product, partial [Rotaria socialis]